MTTCIREVLASNPGWDTDVSEEHIASIFKIEEEAEQDISMEASPVNYPPLILLFGPISL
jgi:hypothetical protein